MPSAKRCKWPVGLSRKPKQAAAFYATLTAAAVLGVAITLSPINPIKALYWTAVINGVVAVPVMTVMMLMTAQPQDHGQVHDLRLAAGARLGVDLGDGRMRRRNGRRLVRLASGDKAFGVSEPSGCRRPSKAAARNSLTIATLKCRIA